MSVASPRTPVSPHGKRVRRADLPPHSNFGGEPYIEAAVIRLPSGSYARSTSRLLRPRRPKAPSRQAFHTTQNPAGYPIRAVALLRVRHGQLTRLASHQLGRSIVGCSSPRHGTPSPSTNSAASSTTPTRSTPAPASPCATASNPTDDRAPITELCQESWCRRRPTRTPPEAPARCTARSR